MTLIAAVPVIIALVLLIASLLTYKPAPHARSYWRLIKENRK